MHWDGDVLPTPPETVVLHDFLLVLSDALPDLAARWLAADVADSPSVRSLAGASPRHPWIVEGLLASTVDELGLDVPTTTRERKAVAVEWVARDWLRNRDARQAIGLLSHLAEMNLDLYLGLDEFIGLAEEWDFPGDWARDREELESRAGQLLTGFLREV
ncbi:hypothetical protein [Frondihabitans peucedani]|uniref:Uncharacterized protein n=1 Tax=Frondihabitans peucedani TaxID=598626 RepID=A0ABP8DZ00_9MICO